MGTEGAGFAEEAEAEGAVTQSVDTWRAGLRGCWALPIGGLAWAGRRPCFEKGAEARR